MKHHTNRRTKAVAVAAAAALIASLAAIGSVSGGDDDSAANDADTNTAGDAVQVAIRPKAGAATLQPVKNFNRIRNVKRRSIALFIEAGKVLQHQRCVNCHPSGDQPLQGELGQLHEPMVMRGKDGFGLVGMRCATCHTESNYGRVPGLPKWHLAPRSMAWQGKTLGQICRQLKDPKLNGNLNTEQLVKHMTHDALVGWAWKPGA
ncbi:MAG: Isoquinoline 1-oxidoreductase subunit, partial [Myxococcota bacterium]